MPLFDTTDNDETLEGWSSGMKILSQAIPTFISIFCQYWFYDAAMNTEEMLEGIRVAIRKAAWEISDGECS